MASAKSHTVRRADSHDDYRSLAKQTGHPWEALADCAVRFVVATNSNGYCGWWAYDQSGEMHTIRMGASLNLVNDGLAACGVVFQETGSEHIITTCPPDRKDIRHLLRAAGFSYAGEKEGVRVYILTKEEHARRTIHHSGSLGNRGG